MTLTIRTTKGSALTYQEMDDNFNGLANGQFITAIASQAQAEDGTDNTQFMTPLRTKQAVVFALANTANIMTATQAQAEDGVDNSVFMTPLRTKQAINFNVVIATQTQAETGTDNTKFMTPLRTKQLIAVTTPTTATGSQAISTGSGGGSGTVSLPANVIHWGVSTTNITADARGSAAAPTVAWSTGGTTSGSIFWRYLA